MTITSIFLDKKTFDDMEVGLCELPLDKPLKMLGLGKIVVLAGPNGGGKSRLLRLIPMLLSKKLTAAVIDETELRLRQNEKALEHWAGQIPDLDRKIKISQGSQKLEDEKKQAQANFATTKVEIERIAKLLKSGMVISTKGNNIPRHVSFVPKQPKLVDPSHATEAQADQQANGLRAATDQAEMNAPAYARQVLRLAVEHGYDRHENGLKEKTPAEKSRDELIAILSSLLGPDVKLSLQKAKLWIGAIENYPEALSPGQQILFQFGCLIHAQSASFADCVLLMDEPENHLHPAVLVQVVDSLLKSLTSGQLWIATHSVPLIAQLMSYDSDCLWLVNNGEIKRSGRSPERVLDSLMGGPDGSRDLHNLTLLPAKYAAVRFLTECLDAPGVVGVDVKDPQTNQIKNIIGLKVRSKKAEGKLVRILDFGAGKGRLLATLCADYSDVSSWLDYYAYDDDKTYQDDCEREITATYCHDPRKRWHSDLGTLAKEIGNDVIDVIVMCNVLHEIDPDQWLTTFGKGSHVHDLLSPDGHLLVVEDYGMPVGERAHRYGFLLLDEKELCDLFDIRTSYLDDNSFVVQNFEEPRYRDRLKAMLIAKKCVARISVETRCSSITALRDRMLESVTSYLQSGNGHESDKGRAYARNAQLLANASSWLKVNG